MKSRMILESSCGTLARHGWEYYPIPPDRVGNIVEDMATIRRLVGSGCYEWQSRNGRIFIRRCE